MLNKTKYEDMGTSWPFLKVPVINESSDSPVDAVAALVYGFLLYRLRCKDPDRRASSRTAIAKHLRLDRKAVNRTVALLLMGGLASECDGKVTAMKPSGQSCDWFRTRKANTSGDWSDGFVYDKVFLPRSSTVLSLRTNILFWHLVRLSKPVEGMPGYFQAGGFAGSPVKRLSTKYLAKGLGCDRRTASRAVKRLRALGLITINQRKWRGKSYFVVGIPPIGTNACLWRSSWKSSKDEGPPDLEITAEELFGVPSAVVLEPALPYDEGAGLTLMAYGIRGKIADKILTKIIKYRINPPVWKKLLAEASRDHERNNEEKLTDGNVKHCGFLLEYMLAEYVKQNLAQHQIARQPRDHNEMNATDLLSGMRLTRNLHELLRTAINAESLPLRGGGCIPCRLNWEVVHGVLRKEGTTFESFQKEVAAYIFSDKRGQPASDWYDAWMAERQIPPFRPAPMTARGFDSKDQRHIRIHAEIVAGGIVGKNNEAEFNTLLNSLIQLGCWQASRTTVGSVTSEIDMLKTVIKEKRLAGDPGVDLGDSEFAAA